MADRVKATFPIGYGLEVPRDADKVAPTGKSDERSFMRLILSSMLIRKSRRLALPRVPSAASSPKTLCVLSGGQEKESSGKLITGADNFTDNSNGLLAIGSADVPVSHHTDAGSVHGAAQDFSLIEFFDELRRANLVRPTSNMTILV